MYTLDSGILHFQDNTADYRRSERPMLNHRTDLLQF